MAKARCFHAIDDDEPDLLARPDARPKPIPPCRIAASVAAIFVPSASAALPFAGLTHQPAWPWQAFRLITHPAHQGIPSLLLHFFISSTPAFRPSLLDQANESSHGTTAPCHRCTSAEPLRHLMQAVETHP
jgi:hypothetical protein